MSGVLPAGSLAYVELGLRLAFVLVAIWAIFRWLAVTRETARESSEALVRAAAPDVTPYELLPNAGQREEAVRAWEVERARRAGWIWDAQIARMLALCAALAALGAAGAASWPAFVWVPVGLASFAPLYKISQLRDQQAQALRALASRRDELIGNINTPA